MDNHDPSIAFFPDTCIFPKSGYKDNHGYSVLGFSRAPAIGAHRIAYRMFKGETPKGMFVMHTCDNRECINPKHLYLGTYSDKNLKAINNRLPVIGVDNPSAKLNPDIVKFIRETDMRGVDLAEKHGVSKQCISNVRAGRSWKHVKATQENGND